MASSDDVQGGLHTVDEGQFAGWETWVGSPFETLIGPFYSRTADDGTVTCAFAPQEKNTNYVGILHGGAIMTFADAAAPIDPARRGSGPFGDIPRNINRYVR